MTTPPPLEPARTLDEPPVTGAFDQPADGGVVPEHRPSTQGLRETAPRRDPSPPAASPSVSSTPVPPERDGVASAGRARRSYVLTAQSVLLAMVATGFILMFTLIEPSPRWLVLLGTALTTLALDGVLRAGRRAAFAEGGLDTQPLLLVPALYMLTMPVFVEHATLGFAMPVVALAAGAGYGALVVGQLSSAREFDPGRQLGRFIAAAATYLVAFGLFALVFLFGVAQQPASLAVGLAAMLLAAEILREGEIDPAETLLYAVVTGLVVAEVRWLMHYLPIDGYAGALTLLLAFYLTTGLLHSHVVRQLSRSVATTYAEVGLGGVAFIAVVRALGVA